MLLAVLLTALAAVADAGAKYKAFADTIRAEVFGAELPAFGVKEIPQKYGKESAVIKAVYQNIEARKRTGLGVGVGIIGLPSVTRRARVEFGHLTRMLLHINDKAALEKYSEFDFDIDSKESFFRGYEKKRHAMGVRLVKPDGRIVDIDTSDFVEVSEGKDGKKKSRKLAIPGLEVGDDIDLFFYTETKLQNAHPDPVTFRLKDDVPIMNYRIHCVIDDNLTTQYRCMNGAPDFRVSRDEDKNYVLDLELNDISSCEPRLWYNPVRQSPRIRMYVFNRRNKEAFTPQSARKDGLQPNPDVKTILEDRWYLDDTWMEKGSGYYMPLYGAYKDERKIHKALKKQMKAGTIDKRQMADYIYNYLVYAYLGNRVGFNVTDFTQAFRDFTREMGIETKTCIAAHTEQEPTDEMINLTKNVYVVSLADDTTRHYATPLPRMLVPTPGQLDRSLQGQKATMWRKKKERKNAPVEYFTLPVSDIGVNSNVTDVVAAVDGSLLDVRRTESYGGSTKNAVMGLLTFEDVDKAYSSWLNRYGVEPVVREKKKETADRLARYEDSRKNQLDDFKAEVKDYHGSEPAEFADGRVLDLGIDPEQPQLRYGLEYKLGDCVKRAGRNLIVSVGRLFSSQLALLPADRSREDDAWSGTLRQYVTNISLAVPEGYRPDARSLAALDRTVANDAGEFSVSAREADGKVEIVIRKQYRKAVLPAAEWPQMLKVLDAAAEWNSLSLVFEKRS